jgi:pimeloyl-ACP methyl ester carboxylesterase
MNQNYPPGLVRKARFLGKIINTTAWIAPSFAGRMSLKIFSKPRSGRPNERQSLYLNTANSFVMEGENGKIQCYHWKNSGPLVLLMHGWESNAGRWQALHKLLFAQGFSILSFDAPAHGNSEGESFNAKVYGDNAGLLFNKFEVSFAVGHSIGAGSLLYSVHHYRPTHLKAIVLLAPPIGIKAAYDRYAELMGYNSVLWPLFCDAIYHRFGLKAESFDGIEFGKGIAQKTLIIHDPDETVIPFSESEAIAEVIKNVRLKRMEGQGHRLQHGKVYREILDFFLSLGED